MNDEERKKEFERNKQIENLMFETMQKAKELNCEIKVNAKTGKMSWRKY